MGIVNITPDSFSADGLLSPKKHKDPLRFAQKLIREGADIIDIGGESSRPGAKKISTKEELRRVIPTVKRLAKKASVPISVDTYKPEVAQQALDAGATIINNIMGTPADKKLLRLIKAYDAAIVLMHIKGTPETMQKNISYTHAVDEIIDSLRISIGNCLETGIDSDKIIIDPGIGFGKTLEHNLEIINRLHAFSALGCPLLIGTSRKSFIGKTLDKQADKRQWGTAATVCASILRGAHIIRVHDVKAMKEIARMSDAIINETIEL